MADKEVTKKQTRKTPVQAGTVGKHKEKREVAYVAKERDTEDIRKKTQTEEEPSILKDILSISGQSGLFKYISQARNGMIVESLESGKRTHAFSTMRINSLRDIAIFTSEEEITLEEVFRKIHEKEHGGPAIDNKSDPGKLKAYFSEIIPDYNEDRVYISDIRKVVGWYNILHGLDMLQFGKETADEGENKSEKKVKPGSKKKS